MRSSCSLATPGCKTSQSWEWSHLHRTDAHLAPIDWTQLLPPFYNNLSRRLEYLLLFELPKNVVFLYQPVREPLRSDYVIIDPIWIEALYSWVLAQLPILMLAGLASAESAVQLGLLLKANCLDRWFLKFVNTTFNSHTLDMSTLSKWGDCFENSIFLLIVRGDMFLQRYRVMLSHNYRSRKYNCLPFVKMAYSSFFIEITMLLEALFSSLTPISSPKSWA